MKISGVMAFFILVLGLGLSGSAQATDVVAGHDLWSTPPGGAVEDFGGVNTVEPDDDVEALPADFFDPGSDPFTGQIDFVGVPLGLFLGQPTGGADTIVERLIDASLPTVPTTDTIPIELVALSLTSTSPITVTYNGGLAPEQWDVDVTLSPTNPSLGTMTIQHTTSGGGIYSAIIGVCPLLTFTRQSDSTVRPLDVCDIPLHSPQNVQADDNNWSHTAVLPLESPLSGPNFFVIGPTEHTGPHPAAEPIETPDIPDVPGASTWALALLGAVFLAILGFKPRRYRLA